MTRLAAYLTIAFAAFAVSAADDEPATIVGKWILISTTDPDIRGDVDSPNVIRLEFEDDTFKVNVTGGGAGCRDFDGTYIVDATQTPNLLDVTLRDGETKLIYAVYHLSGKRLIVRFRMDNVRPTGVEGKEDGSINLVFRRDDGSR